MCDSCRAKPPAVPSGTTRSCCLASLTKRLPSGGGGAISFPQRALLSPWASTTLIPVPVAALAINCVRQASQISVPQPPLMPALRRDGVREGVEWMVSVLNDNESAAARNR